MPLTAAASGAEALANAAKFTAAPPRISELEGLIRLCQQPFDITPLSQD
jgi:hypothetical protein